MLYDTFSFKLTLPPSSSTVEFCVCFRADSKEFWDNNDVSVHNTHNRSSFAFIYKRFCFVLQDKNYILYKKRSTFATQSPGILMHMQQHKAGFNYNNSVPQKATDTTTPPISIPNNKYHDLTQSKMTSYSEFASWNHLDNQSAGPYW